MRSGYMADYGGNKMKVLTQQDIVESWVSPVVRVETLREILQDLIITQGCNRHDGDCDTFSVNDIKKRFGLLFKEVKPFKRRCQRCEL